MSWPRLYFLPAYQEFCEAPPGTSYALAITDNTVILKCTYLGPDQLDDAARGQAIQKLNESPSHAVLRLIPSPDGAPFRTSIIFVMEGNIQVKRVQDLRLGHIKVGSDNTDAFQYGAQALGKLSPLQTDYEKGTPGFIVTGTPNSIELWRVTRLELDGIRRYVVTMSPVRPSFGIVTPKLQSVAQPLRGVLLQHFEELQQALSRSSPFGVIDRAYNLTEGILEYCLQAVEKSGNTLDERLQEAKTLLEKRPPDERFPLDYFGYHLAQKIRFLHKYLHVDQSVGKGKKIRPELGLSAAVDVGELMAVVGLGTYQ